MLDAVDDAYEERSDLIAEPEWVYWLNRAEIDVMAARCHIALGAAARAEPLLSRALAGYDPAHAREVARYETWLAEGHGRSGDLDAARAALARSSAATTDSVRLRGRIAAVGHLIDRRAGKRTVGGSADVAAVTP